MTDLIETLKRALGDAYTFQRELVGGGMSRVFVAHDRTLDRLVAVKVLSGEVAADVKAERFRLEIQLAAKLQHPHIVPLLASGEVEGKPYFTMPFIEGESLRGRLAREGELPISDAIRTLRQIASALSYAHRQGVVHRDIKPDNVLLTDEFALVTDFGVAKALSASTETARGHITTSGVAIGTPSYMSPEQAAADPAIDHRADIYAFGIVAYEVFTGSPPFQGRSPQAILAAHAVQTPEPIENRRSGIPPAVVDLVMRCLAKRPADRPQNATELLQVFDAVGSSASIGTVARLPTPATSGRRKWILAGVAAAAVAAIGFFIAKGISTENTGASADLSSVAVLPLVNVGGSQTDEYFSDGMTDELANALSKLPGLRVASRTSAYAFKGRRTDVGEIGRKLKVQAVLDGSVRRSGDRLRVHAQLVNVSDGLSLWSEVYERQTSDVFEVQDDIAKSIADALKLKLGRRAQQFASDARGTSNLGAYDRYIRGRYLWNSRGAENLRKAIAHFDEAIKQDAAFARAHAARAIAFALLPEYTDTPPPNVSDLAREAADRALKLDPTLAEAYTALGLVGVHDWRYPDAETAYRKALELDPRYATAHQWYGEFLYHTGRADSAIAQIRIARDLDPLAPIIPAALGYALMMLRRYDDAIAELKRGIELAPALGLHHALLGQAYLMKGDRAQGVTAVETAARLDPELTSRQGLLAYGYAVSGQQDRAREILARLRSRLSSNAVSPVAVAFAHLGLGEYNETLVLLEQAVEAHDISLLTSSTLLLDAMYDPIRNDPRFQNLLRRMNLEQYADRQPPPRR
ncbi:MAG TPA: protein kinase [Gemmatimonadaceae bacterium]|nr:protein kinase [Gemmatimonadaceae bacterium]